MWEYGGSIWYDVVIRDPKNALELDAVRGLRFMKSKDLKGRTCVLGVQYIQLVGTEDHRYRTQANKREYQDNEHHWRKRPRCRTVQATQDAIIEIIYHRGSEQFLERRFLRSHRDG